MRRLLVVPIAFVVCALPAAGQTAPGLAGSWTGGLSFARPAGTAVMPISIELRARRSIVSLGRGHAARTELTARIARGRLRISLPGRPARIILDGRLKRGRLSGTVRQGSLRGSFSLRRGRSLEESALGLYRFDDGRPLGVWSGQGPRIASLYDEGEIRGLYRTRPNGYVIGSGLQTRNPTAGAARFAAGAATWRGARATRVALRQEEVFVRSGQALLGCTLSIPPGSGRRPGVVFAHGSGPAPRSYNSINALYFNHLGLATLSCDKRGIGQSGGIYPGEFPSAPAVDQYARDVQAQARFLAAQPEIDAARVGVAGVSQAGWIMPLAVVREPTLRFMVGFVSPTLTQGETDLWATLNDQGQSPPTRTDEDMEAEVRRAGPSGVDPMPSIRALSVPALWLFGGKDRTVPSRLCVERLNPVTREPGRDLTYRVFPGGTHGLVLTPNGLLAEQARSSRMVDELYNTLRDWLAARGLTG